MEIEGLTFMEAVAAMKQGKKVRRNPRANTWIVWMKDGCFKTDADDCKGKCEMNLTDVQATDWEIVEDKKTLWEKQNKVKERRG